MSKIYKNILMIIIGVCHIIAGIFLFNIGFNVGGSILGNRNTLLSSMMYLSGGILMTIAIFLFILGGIGFKKRLNSGSNRSSTSPSKYSGTFKYILMIIIGIDILISSLVVFWISGNVGGDEGLSPEQFDAQTTYINILTPLGFGILFIGIFKIASLIGGRGSVIYKPIERTLNDFILPPPNIQKVGGKKIEKKNKCEFCYFEISIDDKFCSNCGSKQ